MSTVPTDSVLRRHHEQMQAARSSVPTDSVLRRHYEQMQQATRSSGGSSRAPEPAAPASPRREQPTPAVSRPAATPEPAASSQGGGFLGWLKRLFGG